MTTAKPSNRGGKREGAGRKPAPKAVMRISEETMANARIAKDGGITKQQTFSIPTAAPGVIPKGVKLAMDAAVADPMAYAAIESTFFEGQAFLGYPYLAELTQRAEYRRPSEIIAEELTRKWLKIVSTGSDEIEGKTDKIKAIEAEFKRLNVQSVFRKAAEQDGFYGKSQIYIDTGDTDNPEELKMPLVESADKIKKNGIRGLRTIEPIWTYPNQYDAQDPLREDYYRPVSWYVMGKEVHASRLMTLVSREVPDILKPAYAFGGISLSQMLKPYVDNWLRTRQSVADAVSAFSIMVLSTDLTTVLNGGGGDMLFRRVDMFNRLRDNKGLMVTNKDTEAMTNVSMPLGSLDHLQAQTQEHMSSATGIPLIKAFGITPSGLNASSEGELKNFDDNMDAMANKLFNPHLTRTLNLVQLSLFGEIDPEITFRWEPRRSLDKSELATTRKTEAETDIAYINAGVIMPEEARTRLAGEVDSPYASLDLDIELPNQDEDEEQFQDGEQGDDEDAHAEITGDADKWITVHPNGSGSTGTPALIGENGEVKGGMGGKFNGKNIKDAHGTKQFTSGETNAETEDRHKAEKANDPDAHEVEYKDIVSGEKRKFTTVKPKSNTAGAVTIKDNGLVSLDVKLTDAMKKAGWKQVSVGAGEVTTDPQRGEVLNVIANKIYDGKIALADKPELRELVENYHQIKKDYKANQDKELAPKLAEAKRKDDEALEKFAEQKKELESKIPEGGVKVTFKERANLDGDKFYDAFANGVELESGDFTSLGWATAIRPGALGAFEEEHIAYTMPDQINKRKAEKAKKEQSKEEKLKSDILKITHGKSHDELRKELSELPALARQYDQINNEGYGGGYNPDRDRMERIEWALSKPEIIDANAAKQFEEKQNKIEAENKARLAEYKAEQTQKKAEEEAKRTEVRKATPPKISSIPGRGKGVILNVPYANKDEAKKHGARWSPDLKKWYHPEGTELPEGLKKWAHDCAFDSLFYTPEIEYTDDELAELAEYETPRPD